MRQRKKKQKTPIEAKKLIGSTVSPDTRQGLICLGVILGAHGVRGAVRIKSFAMNSQDIAAYGPLQSVDGDQSFNLTVRGVSRGAVLAEISGIINRERAQALQGIKLYVPRQALPNTEEDEFYHADLIGLTVKTSEGDLYGVIKSIYDHGAGDVIEIERRGEQSVFVPFTQEIVPDIDLNNSQITINLPDQTDHLNSTRNLNNESSH